MNFSKVLLFLFTLIALVTQIIIITHVPDVGSVVLYSFIASTVLTFLINTYVTYHISFDVTEEPK